MGKKTRKELKSLFKQGAMPSGADFADLIESMINSEEDGFEKPVSSDQPLKITAQGVDENILDFCSRDKNPTWRINQKSSDKKRSGLNLSSLDSSKIFIDSSSGKIGVSNDNPGAKVHITQTGNEHAFRIDHNETNTDPVVVDSQGNMGVGTDAPKAKLEVNGNLMANGSIIPIAGNSADKGIMFSQNPGGGGGDAAWIRYYARKGEATTFEVGTSNDGDDHIALMPSGNVGIGINEPGAKLAVNGNIKLQKGTDADTISSDGTLKSNSDSAIPTEKAVKTYVDTRLPKGVIVMWSGDKAPDGWAICNGKNGTPDLQDRFVLGSGKNKINATGGEETHQLTVAEMPSHNHTGNTNTMNKSAKHSHGITTHQDDYNCSSDKKNGKYPSFGADNGDKKAWHSTDSADINHTHAVNKEGGDSSHNNMPPYYVLAYIMKL